MQQHQVVNRLGFISQTLASRYSHRLQENGCEIRSWPFAMRAVMRMQNIVSKQTSVAQSCSTERRALAIGDFDCVEFRETIDWLQRNASLVRRHGLGEAELRGIHDMEPWDTILLFQSHPGQFHQDDVERLRDCLPLTPIVSILGSWCEGETRTGSPLQGVNRTYWHQWPIIAEHQWPSANSMGASWSVPSTAADHERFLATANEDAPTRSSELVIVVAELAETAAAIGDACHQAGYATVWADVDSLGGTARRNCLCR